MNTRFHLPISAHRTTADAPKRSLSPLARLMTVLLVALMAGVMPAWAWDHEDTFKDDGNEDCIFRYNNGTRDYWVEGGFFDFGGVKKTIDASDIRGFRTKTKFDSKKGVFYYEFHVRIIPKTISGNSQGDRKKCYVKGAMYIINEEGSIYNVCTITKKRNDDTAYLTDINGSVGDVMAVNITSAGWLEIKYVPQGNAVNFSKVRFHFDTSSYTSERFWGPFEYEKVMGGNYIPLPEPTFAWGDDGKIRAEVKDAIDGLDNSVYKSQGYDLGYDYTDGDGSYRSSMAYFTITKENATQRKDGLVTAATSIDNSEWAPYTSPLLFTVNRHTVVKHPLRSTGTVTFSDDKCEVLLKPYTHPAEITFDYDQWTKKTVVRWTRTRSVPYSVDRHQKGNVMSSDNGRWYVLRYDPSVSANQRKYKVVGRLDGDANSLQLTDDGEDMNYGSTYVYRVMFIPEPLLKKYGEKPQEMPFASLWKEQTCEATFQVPIRLVQDRTYSNGVKLDWEYNMQADGGEFRIDRREQGGTTWNTMGTLPAEKNGTMATWTDKGGSVCDYYDYRIVTKALDQEVLSGIINGCNTPGGSYITAIDATAGTEEKNVIVTWKVVQVGDDDTYFRVLRRALGSDDDWTMLTDALHGRASEYTFIDDRAMAGSYYEYLVEAYGAKCEEQTVKSDVKSVPGFSQARGTITGHVAYGTGTAVAGVRVNLVKTTADESTDAQQFLSRYIEGEGNGLTWTADEARYDSTFSGKRMATLQLWAKPAVDGAGQMALAKIDGALEIGVKRIGDTSPYVAAVPTQGNYDSQGRFVIASADDWEMFAEMVNSGKTTLGAVMTADIYLGSSQTKVATTVANAYKGAFDGNGHTLTIAYQTSHDFGGEAQERKGYETAPFVYLGNATISNLHVEGTITTDCKYAAGIAGCVLRQNRVNFNRCWSSVTIKGTKPMEAYFGGFVGMVEETAYATFTDCLADGAFTGEGVTKCAGFIGYNFNHFMEFLRYNSCLVILSTANTVKDGRDFNNGYDGYSSNSYCVERRGISNDQGAHITESNLLSTIERLSENWAVVNEHPVLVFNTAQIDYSDKEYITLLSTVVKDGDNGDYSSPVPPIYCLYAVDLTSGVPSRYKVTEFQNLPLDALDFTHVTAVYSNGTWTFAVGNDTLHYVTMAAASTEWKSRTLSADGATTKGAPTLAIGGSQHYTGSAFKGNVDDIRLWSRALSQKEIENNYTRLLGGIENGLQLYWPMDEGMQVKEHIFDIARQSGIYMLNHPVVGVNAQPSAVIPTNLKLYGLTDQGGDYIIRGVPFEQGGTNYKVMPQLGVHEFSPNTRSMFVSPTSLTANNIDFEDVSSFPMSGYVYYAGTNIPAEGIQFYVDGELLTAGGEVKRSDSKGYYQISVPIGRHFVEAKLENHHMVNGGRFPLEGTYNFTKALQHDFADSTLVKFVGRVGGGARNDTLSVGFGASRNNIGMATLTLKLNNPSFSFNCQDDHISDAATTRSWQSDTISINSKAWTGIGAESKYIYIRTDSLTGEFSALLPPLKYAMKGINIDSNSDIEFVSLSEIDLTNVQKELTDSLRLPTVSGDSVMRYYKYNTKLVRTYFAQPQIDVWQSQISGDGNDNENANPNANHAFGLKTIKDYTDDFGTTDINDLWTQKADGSITYRFGYPIYRFGDKVKFGIRGYEVYSNHDTGKAVNDTLAMKAQVLTIGNELSSEQAVLAIKETPSDLGLQPGEIYDVKTNQLTLDVDGYNEFSFTVGLPNIAKPYTRQLNIYYERNNRTYSWNNFNGIVLGSLTSGNNFVTLGPDLVTMVLRDPPGASSKTTWKTGKTATKLRSTSNGYYGDEKFTFDRQGGVKMTMLEGLGLMVEGDMEQTIDGGGGFHYKVTRNNQTDQTWATTSSQSISTGTGSAFVGSRGDVFIGASTNLIIGDCRKLGFFRKGADYPFELDLRNAKSIGDSVRTSFMYSTYELEEVMIPKWKETRLSLMTFCDSEEEARNYRNTSSHCVYTTWLSKDDANLFKEDTYFQFPPAGAKEGEYFPDSVSWCTNQIQSWTDEMARNEEDKVAAMNATKYFERNISFDGGTPNSYSSRTDTTYQKKHMYSHNLGGIFKIGGSSVIAPPGAKFTTKVMWDTENGWTHGWTESDEDENWKHWAEFEYSFSDGNKGTDFSVNIYSSPRGWSDIFSLIGGQSYNPWEAEERTKYYKKGQYVLSNGTERMEYPDIKISTDGKIGAKSAVLTDVPAGQTGQFTLHLTNLSPTVQGFDFSYNLMVQEKTDTLGLEILMDGVPVNGRSVFIPAGETVKKIITVRQTDQSILDYSGLEIWFNSQYQPIKINDKVTFDVHFKPSSSPVDLIVSEPVVNTESKDAKLNLRLTNFDRQFRNLKNVGVQYRYEGDTRWTNLHTYVTSSKDVVSAAYELLPPEGDLRYELDMSSNESYPEGTYHFRGFTTTPYGSEEMQAFSEPVTVIKDMTRPMSLTTPTPANGIYSIGDDLSIEFNEDIVPGYVGDKNVIVTARLNNQEVDHDVSKFIYPNSGVQRTINPVFIQGDCSIEFWMLWGKAGTVLQYGEDRITIAIDDEGHVVIDVDGSKVVSRAVLPSNEWIYFAMSYSATTNTMSALAQYGTTTLRLFENYKFSENTVSAINYSSDHYIYLGEMTGAIHDLSLFNICRNLDEAAATRNQAKDGYVFGLMNHWPMNEGHGFVAADTRHTHDFMVNELWNLSNDNYALYMSNNEGVQADISLINTTPADSYAIELWAKAGFSPTDADSQTVFETGSGRPADKLHLYYDVEGNLFLQYGEKKQEVLSHDDFLYYHNDWNHLALNVVRGQAASFYFNGKRTAVISERDVPPLAGAAIKLGKGMGEDAHIDELRIWHATLSESRLLANQYHCIDTASVYSRGLVAYYPFEKDVMTVDGIYQKEPTLENMLPGATERTAMTGIDKLSTDRIAPPLKYPLREQRLNATAVASNRKIVINLNTTAGISARNLEGSTLNITVDKVFDLHGNVSKPIRWSAYMQLNPLKWTKDSVTVIKQYGDEYTFDVVIVNKGSSVEYYDLYNMPSWLTLVSALDGTPVETDGEVAPLSQKTLRFSVNPLVPVGNYDITIGLQGNDEILEPLRIAMKVSGQMPQWAVDPTKYEHQMSIVGQIYVDGVLVENPESRVAAFIDGECRGIGAPEKVRGAAYVTMNIYGKATAVRNKQTVDVDRGKTVTFRIWDANKGVAYAGASVQLPNGGDTVIFDSDNIYGDFEYPVIWRKTDQVEQQVPINVGWSWIALGVEPQQKGTPTVLNQTATWNVTIKGKTTGMAYCNGAEWNGTLYTIEPNTMYKLWLEPLPNSEELPDYLTVTGRRLDLDRTPVTLSEGWNWIAYTPFVSTNVNTALAGADPQLGDRIKSQYGIAIYGTSNQWEGSLKTLESGHGYMYFSNASQKKQFTWPNVPVAATARPTAHRAPLASGIFTPVDPTNYSDNMSMVIRLTDGGSDITDAEVAAFIGDECRGVAQFDGGLYYLLVAGQGSGQPIQLHIVVGGQTVKADSGIAFSTDANVGTPWDPFVIDLQQLTGISEVNGQSDDEANDQLYDLLGRKVAHQKTADRKLRNGIYVRKGGKIPSIYLHK
jgi:hypothetical protein